MKWGPAMPDIASQRNSHVVLNEFDSSSVIINLYEIATSFSTREIWFMLHFI